MKQLTEILAIFIYIIIKFLVFLFLSPFTICRCLGRCWTHRSFREGWFKFTWIWDAYWNNFKL